MVSRYVDAIVKLPKTKGDYTMKKLKIIAAMCAVTMASVAYPGIALSTSWTYSGESSREDEDTTLDMSWDGVLDADDVLSFELLDAPDEIGGQEVLDEYLPDGIEVVWTGKKFKTPKSASPKVKKDKDTGDYEIVVSEKGEDNPCGLKVSYKKSSGKVSGSFKVYTYSEGKSGKPKIKSWSAKFSGKLGYELSVTIKKAGNFTATLE